jgi:teichuronic acid biosynthesis protein TuaE
MQATVRIRRDLHTLRVGVAGSCPCTTTSLEVEPFVSFTSTSVARPMSRATAMSRTTALVLIAAIAAAIVGYLASHSSTVAAGAVCALLLGALLARIPAVMFGICLFALCYGPEYLSPGAGVFAQPQLQKGLVYFAILGMALQRGVRPRLLVVPLAYILMAALAILSGHLIPGLTVSQMLSSFVTLTVGWTGLAVAWDLRTDARYLKILALLPVASVLLGALLQVVHVDTLFQYGAGSRLQGASQPAQLALTCFIGCVTASICYRVTRWKYAPLLVGANAVILGLTVSRGAAIATGLALAWPALRFVFSGPEDKRWVPQRWLRATIVLGALAIVAAVLVPALLARDKTGTYIQGQGVVFDSTSGRTVAWHQFYTIAKQAPLFGHGLGAGPITKIAEKGFLAQHNEYLRLFLEGGYVGGGIVLAAIIFVIGTCIRRAPSWIRLDLLGLAIGFAVLSYTDNTLTSCNLQVPFCLVFGILAGTSIRRSRAPDPVPTVTRTSVERPLQTVG